MALHDTCCGCFVSQQLLAIIHPATTKTITFLRKRNMNFVKTDGINALIAMGSTDGRVYSGQRQGGRKGGNVHSRVPRHTRGRPDNPRCRLIGLEARSTVVVSRIIAVVLFHIISLLARKAAIINCQNISLTRVQYSHRKGENNLHR